MMNIILLGPPGVGKGTTAKILSGKFNMPTIGTGDLLRAEMSKDSELGRKARAYVDSGQLVPDEIVTEMVRARITQDDLKSGYFLDGYPRTIEQAKSLKDVTTIDKVLNFVVPKKTAIERIKGRDQKRTDDSPDIIIQRINIYNEKTQPLIDFYRNEEILFDIDSVQDVDGVVKQCTEILSRE